MPDIRITNCHIHTFTDDHVPRWFPHPLAVPFRRMPWLARLLGKGLNGIGQERLGDRLRRLARFGEAGQKGSQAAVLRDALPLYPPGTRFVILPMDMAPAGFGQPRRDLPDQHDELAALARDPQLGPLVLPFATIHPDRPGAVAELMRALDMHHADGRRIFHGLKLYPRLGYAPDHPLLMREVYPEIQRRGLPVITHCSRGGVTQRGLSRDRANAFCGPDAVLEVLKRFPELRLCLAHFGGDADWEAYVETGIDPFDPVARLNNWQVRIRDLIGSGEFPNLWTDISYTIFRFEEFLPFLRLFLLEEGDKADRLRDRVLFGSDFYMTRQESLSERAICFRLRNALGDDLFRRIAETNPRIWLGEAA